MSVLNLRAERASTADTQASIASNTGQEETSTCIHCLTNFQTPKDKQ